VGIAMGESDALKNPPKQKKVLIKDCEKKNGAKNPPQSQKGVNGIPKKKKKKNAEKGCRGEKIVQRKRSCEQGKMNPGK